MYHLRKPLLIGVTSWNYCLTYNEDLKHQSGAGLSCRTRAWAPTSRKRDSTERVWVPQGGPVGKQRPHEFTGYPRVREEWRSDSKNSL